MSPLVMFVVATAVGLVVGLCLGAWLMFMWMMNRDAKAVDDSHKRLLDLVSELNAEQFEENRRMFQAGIFSDQISLARIDLISGRTGRMIDAITEHSQRLLASMVAVPSTRAMERS
jgi:hypothetical protein